MTAEKDVRCSRCDEVVGTVVTEGGRATIRLSTSSHGDTLPITCPRGGFAPVLPRLRGVGAAPPSDPPRLWWIHEPKPLRPITTEDQPC